MITHPLDEDEREELEKLRAYDRSCEGGDRPMSPSITKLRRLMELERRDREAREYER